MLTFPVYPHHEVDICGFKRYALLTIERIAFKFGAGVPALARMYNVNLNLFSVKSLRDKKKKTFNIPLSAWYSEFTLNSETLT